MSPRFSGRARAARFKPKPVLVASAISTGRHYPDAVHLTGAYRWLGYEPGAFPIAERHADRVLSLPIFPGMTIEAAETVVSGVAAFFDGD